MIGPGKYDAICTSARDQAKARSAIVIILGGEKGNGFEVQATLEDTLKLPDMLEIMAKQIRAIHKSGTL